MSRPALALIALGALLSGPTHAGAPDLFGYGARAQGMAGAVVSAPEGHAAVYYNPGALAFEARPTVAAGYQRAAFDLEIDGEAHDARDATASFIGFGLPLPLGGLLERRLAIGCGFVIPTNSVLIADIPRPGAPRFALVENHAQTVTLMGAVGLRLTDWAAIGAGFAALSALDGAIDVAPNAEGRIGSQARDQLVAEYAPIVGGLLRLPWLGLRAGVAWRQALRAPFTLPITADLGDAFPIPVPTLVIEGTAQFDPEQVAAEVSATPWQNLRVAAGLTWKRWSDYQNPIVYTAVPADFPAQPAPDFADIIEWRAGVEWPIEAGPLVVTPRLGYQLSPTPAPEQTGVHGYLDGNRHLFALGAGLRYDRLRFEVAGQWHRLVERRHTKDLMAIEEAGFDPETHPGTPTLRHRGDVRGFAIELGVEL